MELEWSVLKLSCSWRALDEADENVVQWRKHLIERTDVQSFVDEELDIQVHETVKSNEIIAFTTTTQKMDLGVFLKKADFPNHALIVKPQLGKGAIKGVRTLQELEEAILKSRDASSNGEAIIESDLRAMSSPSRQKNISAVALKLAQRMSRTCPECSVPGWGLKSYVRGVECSECGEVSEEAARQELLGCVACEFTALGAVINLTLDPSRCMSCNPWKIPSL